LSETYVTHLAIIVTLFTEIPVIEKERSLVSKNSNSLNSMIKRTSVIINNSHLKKITAITTSIIMLSVVGTFGFSPIEEAFAKGKPLDVIDRSNGFPSGKHFNLIIHGKTSFDSADCGTGGKSLFTPLDSTEGKPGTNQTMQMYVNKKSSLSTLVVRDKCTEAFDNDPAQVQLPTKIETDEGFVKIDGGFWVFARVLGTPNNSGHGDHISKIALWPDPKIEACNLTEDEDAGTASDCFDSSGNKQEFVDLGFVTKNGIYKCADEMDPDIPDDYCDEQGLERYTTETSGKGAKKAVDITPLFLWSGVGCLDADGSKTINFNDFIDADGSGNVTAGDFLNHEDGDTKSLVTEDHIHDAYTATGNPEPAFLSIAFPSDEFDQLIIILGQDPAFEGCVFEENTWVFDVFGADLVIQNQTLTNDGVRTLQIRFYPQQTTLFEPAYDLDSIPE